MKTQQQLRDLIADTAHGERRLRTGYSGRGMYGKTCYGITCDDPEDVIAEVGIKGARMDNMGRRIIVYWPQIAGEEER